MNSIIRIFILFALLVGAVSVKAQEPMLGEIRWVPYNFAPQGWAFCDGQLLPIAQNSALFSLLGTTYGGDGRTTFALPDLRGRVMVHAGAGPGLSSYQLGQKGGAEQVTLTTNEIPSHSHQLNGSESIADAEIPDDNRLAAKQRTKLYSTDKGATTAMDTASISESGGSSPHENRPPYQTLNCIIALQGLFPSRN